jgi:hypothetical protein
LPAVGLEQTEAAFAEIHIRMHDRGLQGQL